MKRRCWWLRLEEHVGGASRELGRIEVRELACLRRTVWKRCGSRRCSWFRSLCSALICSRGRSCRSQLSGSFTRLTSFPTFEKPVISTSIVHVPLFTSAGVFALGPGDGRYRVIGLLRCDSCPRHRKTIEFYDSAMLGYSKLRDGEKK